MAQLESQKLKLLVVDDESDNLDLLYRTFRHDFDVFRADSAPNALTVLEQEGEMAIIISDQRMPKMKGTELLSRTVQNFPDTIRIVLTGYTDVEDLVDAINTGKVFKYITKPWNPAELKSVVQQASETYRAIKRRTNELHRALRRESVFNAMITAIRESLDYRQILETTVNTLGRTLSADASVLIPVERFNPDAEQPYQFVSEHFVYQASSLTKRLSHSERRHPGRVESGDITPTPSMAAGQEIGVDSKPPFMQTTPASSEGESKLYLRELLPSTALISALQRRQIQNYVLERNHHHYAQLVVPLVYQQEALAVLALLKVNTKKGWTLEEQRLVSDVAEQAALAISQARLYQQIQEQTEQMRDELTVARRIQTHLLCQSIPQIEGIKIQACCAPAREVGGDFFEIYDHPNGDVWLAVGDVSGKGVPAALFMSSTLSVLRRELSQETPPAPDEVLRNLNGHLLDGLVGSNSFITLALACYTPTTRRLVYANAGHIFPMLWSRSALAISNDPAPQSGQTSPNPRSEPQYLKVRGVPLGILETWIATSETLQLQPGDTFLLASDGITEARVSPEWLQVLSPKADEPADPRCDSSTLNDDVQRTSSSLSEGDRPCDRDYPMLRQRGLWHLLQQCQTTPSLEAVLAKIQAHSLGQEDDQTILSMEIL